MYQFCMSEIQAFGLYLWEQERSLGTVERYLRYLEQFISGLQKKHKHSHCLQRLFDALPLSRRCKYNSCCAH